MAADGCGVLGASVPSRTEKRMSGKAMHPVVTTAWIIHSGNAPSCFVKFLSKGGLIRCEFQ